MDNAAMITMDYMREDYDGDAVDRAADFLADILSYMGYDAEIHTEVVDSTAVFDIIGPDAAPLSPGTDPSIVNALAWILKRASFCLGSGFRFDVDVNGYRLERVHSLEETAKSIGDKIAEGAGPIQCFGMDSVERRALHLLLKDNPGTHTRSEGFGNFRHLEISSAK